MSVYRHKGSNRYQYDFQVAGKRYQGPTGTDNKRAAEEYERRKRRELAEGRLGTLSEMTLREACDRYWDEHGQFLKSASDKERRLNVLCDLIGENTRLIDITAATLLTAKAKRRVMLYSRSKQAGANAFRIGPTTLNKDVMGTYRPLVDYAREAWKITGLPEIDWHPEKKKGGGGRKAVKLYEDEPAPKALEFTEEEIQAVLAELLPHWHQLVLFACTYGVRLGELYFSLDDLNLANPQEAEVTLRNRKGPEGTDNTLVLPLREEDVPWLALRKERARKQGLDTIWFRELKDGRLKALSYHSVQSAIGDAFEATGLRKSKGAKGPHAFRHHAAMKVLRASNLLVVQKFLGHASVQSTVVYAHALKQDVKDALQAVPRNSPVVANDDLKTPVYTKRRRKA